MEERERERESSKTCFIMADVAKLKCENNRIILGKSGRGRKSKAAAWAVLSKMPQLQAQVGRDWSRTRTASDDVSRWREITSPDHCGQHVRGCRSHIIKGHRVHSVCRCLVMSPERRMLSVTACVSLLLLAHVNVASPPPCDR